MNKKSLIKTIVFILSLLRIDIRKILVNSMLTNIHGSNYPELIYGGKVGCAEGIYLDYIGFRYSVYRNFLESDDSYRKKIIFLIKANSTIESLEETLTLYLALHNVTGKVTVIESYNNFFDAYSSSFDFPLRDENDCLFFGVSINIILDNTVNISPIRIREMLNRNIMAGIRIENIDILIRKNRQ